MTRELRRPRGPRARLLLAAALLGLAAAPAEPRPRGRLLWTSMATRSARLTGRWLLPSGAPTHLHRDGPVTVDPQGYLRDRGRALEAAVEVDPAHPRARLAFLHPALDATGARVLFAAGPTWGPDSLPGPRPAAAPRGAVSGGGLAIQLPGAGVPPTDPVGAGAVMDGFPSVDPATGAVLFARFFYRDGPEGGAGWFLMRRLPNRRDPRAEVVRDARGTPVRGHQPAVTADGRHLVYVKPDPENAGSDVWTLPLDPLGEERLLAEGEGPLRRPRRGADPRASAADGAGADAVEVWNAYATMGGRARVSHPTLSLRAGLLAYASDRDGDWDVYLREVEVDEAGALRAVGEERPLLPEAVSGPAPGTGFPDRRGDSTDESWPAFSGDGRYLAYMSDRADGGARGPSRIWVAGAGASDGPGVEDHHEVVSAGPAGGEDAALWPAWDQDLDPPHLMITLSPEGGGEPMTLTLVQEAPMLRPGADVVSLSLRMRDHHPAVPPPGVDVPEAFPPIRVGVGGGAPPARVVYPTGERGEGEDLRLLLSGRRDGLERHRGLRALGGVGGTVPGRGDPVPLPAELTAASFDGLYTWEDVRIQVEVLARDDRWRRVGVPEDLAPVLYPEGVPPPEVEGVDLRREDPRVMGRELPEAPYLRRVTRDRILRGGWPGVAWWVEERPAGSAPGTPWRVRDENAPYLLFRSANTPAEDHPDAVEVLLRVVARDLMHNVTDVRIPIHVRPRGFEVDTLSLGTERRSL